MSRIAVVEESQAQGSVKVIYEGIKKQMGIVPNVFKSASSWPELLKSIVKLFETVMTSETRLPRATKEMIAALVSKLNRCQYCVTHHVNFMAQYGVSEAIAQKISQDYHRADLDDKILRLLEFSEKVSKEAYKVTDGDFEELKGFGWTEREILEAIAVVAQFNFLNRIVDALGVSLETASSEKA